MGLKNPTKKRNDLVVSHPFRGPNLNPRKSPALPSSKPVDLNTGCWYQGNFIIFSKKNLWHTVYILSYTKKITWYQKSKSWKWTNFGKKLKTSLKRIGTSVTSPHYWPKILPGSAVRLPPVLKPQEKLVQDSGWWHDMIAQECSCHMCQGHPTPYIGDGHPTFNRKSL